MSEIIKKNKNVWTIIHSRPEARNAMDPKSADELYKAFLEFEANEDAYVAVLWGEGGAFCSGWDLKYASSLSSDGNPLEKLNIKKNRDNNAYGEDIPRGPLGPTRLELSKPVIAAISGPAVAGGMELALWCDFRVMEESAYFGVYCRRWGIPLIDGGTVRLPKLIGQGKALEITLTGRQILSEECYKIGLCEYIVDNNTSREKAEEIALDISRFPQECVRADRKSIINQTNLNIKKGLEFEWYNSCNVFKKEGIEGANKFKKGYGRHGDFKKI